MKKNSIFFRFFIYFIIFTLILVVTIWFSQVFFFRVFKSKKVEIIESSVLTIDEMIKKEE